ncbi:MAG: hypothetical protein GC205_04555 [Bacteroidetes bacterium]|nr:hypothetical protein [Bacteroidota bacterium]
MAKLRAFRSLFLALSAGFVHIFPVQGQPLPGTDIVVFSLSWNDRDRPVLSDPLRVTDREGYNNQPSFSPDGTALLFTAQQGNQTDIFSYSFATGALQALTETPESEYSPQYASDGQSVFVVRVEMRDSLQRLWRFPLDGGKPRLVMDAIEPVGYFAWLNDDLVAVFVLGLGEKNTLQVGPAAKQKMRIVGADIGRCLARVPGREALSFVQLQGSSAAVLRVYDAENQRVQESIELLPDAQDYAWTPDAHLLMGAGSRLYVNEPFSGARWHFAADLGEMLPSAWQLHEVTRMAVSPDGKRLAVVLARSGEQ